LIKIKIKGFIQSFFDDEKLTTIHPKTGKHIEYVFSCGGRNYFQYMHDWEYPRLRLEWMNGFAQDMDLRIKRNDLIEFIDKSISLIDEGKYSESAKLLFEIKDRSQILFNPDCLYRVASGFYFDLGERLDIYDEKYNDAKISLWKKKDLTEYFLKKLISDSDSFSKSYKGDLKAYLLKFRKENEKLQEYLGDLNQ